MSTQRIPECDQCVTLVSWQVLQNWKCRSTKCPHKEVQCETRVWPMQDQCMTSVISQVLQNWKRRSTKCPHKEVQCETSVWPMHDQFMTSMISQVLQNWNADPLSIHTKKPSVWQVWGQRFFKMENADPLNVPRKKTSVWHLWVYRFCKIVNSDPLNVTQRSPVLDQCVTSVRSQVLQNWKCRSTKLHHKEVMSETSVWPVCDLYVGSAKLKMQNH